AGSDLNRSVGVSGRYDFRAMAAMESYEVDLLPFLQRHDRLFPMRFAAEIGATLAFLFSGIIAGVHVRYLLLEKLLDRLFDLNLVSPRTNAEDGLGLL